MANNTLVAGALLMMLLLVLEWLPPQESLRPSPRTRWLLGCAGGVVSHHRHRASSPSSARSGKPLARSASTVRLT